MSADDPPEGPLPSERQSYLDYAFQALSREEMIEALIEWDPKLVELIRSSKQESGKTAKDLVHT